ncbi:hypothetical protein GQ42DRAFT_124338 [Ramicandelaber brevisporus]|nr:hypothetical protein GQ42DRAFT_124338 [Ramicandelaber brevisporus]
MVAGKATFYDAGSGSCGLVNKDSDRIVAISHLIYGQYANPNTAAVCGQCLSVRSNVTGKSTKVTITDKCMGCDRSHIDLSKAAWDDLGISQDAGVIGISFTLTKC